MAGSRAAGRRKAPSAKQGVRTALCSPRRFRSVNGCANFPNALGLTLRVLECTCRARTFCQQFLS